MKKILFIAYYYPPMKSGIQRPLNFIKYLSRNQYSITVLSSSYRKSEFKHNLIRIFDISFNKNKKGYRFFIWMCLRVISAAINKMGYSHSIYRWWKNNVIRKSNKIIEFVQPDLIITTYPPVETLELGIFLSEKYSIPMISDFRDGPSFEPIEKKIIQKSDFMENFYKKIERDTVERSSHIITVSDPITEYFKKEYNIKKVSTIYTGYDPDEYLEVLGRVPLLDKNFFNIVFTGHLNLSDSSNRIGSFFGAISELIEQDKELEKKIRIYIAGEFAKKEILLLNELINKNVLINCGLLNRKDAIHMQKQADLLLIITSISRTSIVTTKIFEYLKSGRPVLGLTHMTELGKIIKSTEIGRVVHPFDKEAIKDALIMMKKKIESDELFRPDRKKIDSFSIVEQISKLDSSIVDVLN